MMIAGIETTLQELNDRYYRFSQQQRSFIEALSNGRQNAQVAYQPIKTLSDLSQLLSGSHLERLNDVRIIETFILLCDDLEGLRKDVKRTLIDLLRENHKLKYKPSCKKLVYSMKKWRKYLDAEFDFSELRASYPHNVVNKLSVAESKEFFGGVVSLLPYVLDTAKMAVRYLKDLSRGSALAERSEFGSPSLDLSQSARSRPKTVGALSRASQPTSQKPNDVGSTREQENEENEFSIQEKPKSALSVPKTASSKRSVVITPDGRISIQSVASEKTDNLARRDTPVAPLERAKTSISKHSSASLPRTPGAARAVSRSLDARADSPAKSRPKTVSTVKLSKIQNVDEGVFHGDEDNTPAINRIPSRLSTRKAPSRPVSRSLSTDRENLSAIRKKLLSNPSDISVIQQKLRNLYCRSAASQKSFNMDQPFKTPSRVSMRSDRSVVKLKPVKTPSVVKSIIDKDQASEKKESNRDDEKKTENEILSLKAEDVEGFEHDKEEENWADIPASPPKASAAPSSRQLRDLLGYDMRSKVGNEPPKRPSSRLSSSQLSTVPSLTRPALKEREVLTPMLSEFKLTVPRSRNTEKQWQP